MLFPLCWLRHPSLLSLLLASAPMLAACADVPSTPAHDGESGDDVRAGDDDDRDEGRDVDAGAAATTDAAMRRDAALPALDAARAEAGTDGSSGRDGADAGPSARADASTAPTPRDAGAAAADGAGCTGAVLCEGFESASGAMPPSGWKSAADDCSGNGKVEIDGTVHHAGARSVRIDSAGGYCNHAFAAATAELSGLEDLWVRFWVRFDKAPGSEHVTFLTMRDAVSGKHLRMGVQSGILMWNREKDDATLPELSPKGISLSTAPKAQTFQCIEFHLAGEAGTLETFVDGARVEGLVVDGTPTTDVDGQWLRPGVFRAQVSELRLGWESYGSTPMTVWFDDVAVARSRPGC